LFEDSEESQTPTGAESSSVSRSKTISADSSPLFQDDPNNHQPPDFLSLENTNPSMLPKARTSVSSTTSSWSKVTQEEVEYRERNSFFLLPPPPPPRSAERKKLL
jgi:hypothetical protein